MNPVRAGSPAATARRLGTVLPPLRRKRKDLPPELCAALDRALSPRPEDRGTLDELADELAAGLTDVSDEGGTILAHPLERPRTAALPPVAGRIAAALAGAGLAAAAVTLVPGEPVAPLAAAGAAAVAIARAAAGRLAGVRGRARLPARARPARAPRSWCWRGSAAAAALVRGSGHAWSLPAAAPLLGLVSLAGAYPAVAGRAARWWQRAGLGAAGLWWLLLAEPLLGTHAALRRRPAARLGGRRRPRRSTACCGRRCAPGSSRSPPSGRWRRSCCPGSCAAATPASTSSAASAWAAGLGAGTAALAEWAGAAPPRGLVAGAIAAGALAWLLPRLLPRDIVDAPR